MSCARIVFEARVGSEESGTSEHEPPHLRTLAAQILRHLNKKYYSYLSQALVSVSSELRGPQLLHQGACANPALSSPTALLVRSSDIALALSKAEKI
jgi:hypothetical protein